MNDLQLWLWRLRLLLHFDSIHCYKRQTIEYTNHVMYVGNYLAAEPLWSLASFLIFVNHRATDFTPSKTFESAQWKCCAAFLQIFVMKSGARTIKHIYFDRVKTVALWSAKNKKIKRTIKGYGSAASHDIAKELLNWH